MYKCVLPILMLVFCSSCYGKYFPVDNDFESLEVRYSFLNNGNRIKMGIDEWLKIKPIMSLTSEDDEYIRAFVENVIQPEQMSNDKSSSNNKCLYIDILIEIKSEYRSYLLFSDGEYLYDFDNKYKRKIDKEFRKNFHYFNNTDPSLDILSSPRTAKCEE